MTGALSVTPGPPIGSDEGAAPSMRQDAVGRADAVLMRPVRMGNAFEETVARLLQVIRLGVVEPGGALPPERELADRFSVGRDTLRDAIRSLANAGYLVSRRGRYGGTFVRNPLPLISDGQPPDPQELEDVLVLREILEVGGVRAAASRTLTSLDREVLWMRVRENTSSNPVDFRRLDSRLHLAIAEVSGAPSLVPLVADNRTRLNLFFAQIPLLPRNIVHSNHQHEGIVAAILMGDPSGAAALMEEHLAGSALLLRGFLF